MITDLPMRTIRKRRPVSVEDRHAQALKNLDKVRPEERYYSFIHPSEKGGSPCIHVACDVTNDVLQIEMVNMTISECYLFAFGLPLNFPTEQIIVLGDDRSKYVSSRTYDASDQERYDYEVSVPFKMSMESYLQQMVNDLDTHFGLDVRIEQLATVKGSKAILTDQGESVELIWQEQPMMIMKSKSKAKPIIKDKKLAERM